MAEKPARTYNPYREKQRDSRDERREARAAARLALRQRFEAQRAEARTAAKLAREARQASERSALRELAASARAERDRIHSSALSESDRKARLSILAMRTVARREEIKIAASAAREAAPKAPGYKDWCGQLAESGDEAAIAQLKGWAYQDSRRRSAAEKAEREAAERGALLAASPAPDSPARPVLDGLAWAVDRRTGDVTYSLDGREALRDTGRLVAVLQPLDAASIEAGLRLAAQKFGPTLTLSGPQEFRQRVIELAAEKGLGVRFADPAAEAYRARLEAARQAKKHQEMTNDQHQNWSKSDYRQVRGPQSRGGRSGR
jgi:hypothetical protein